MESWRYIFDEFRSLDIEPLTLFELTKKDSLKLFDYVEEVVERRAKHVQLDRWFKKCSPCTRWFWGLVARLAVIAVIVGLGFCWGKLFEALLTLVTILQFELAYRQY